MAKKVNAVEVVQTKKGDFNPKNLSVVFYEKKSKLVSELQETMKTNEAFARNIFPKKIADLIEEMQGQLVSETRMGNAGPFEFWRIQFSDGSFANLPTEKALDQVIQKNEWAHNIQRHLQRAE